MSPQDPSRRIEALDEFGARLTAAVRTELDTRPDAKVRGRRRGAIAATVLLAAGVAFTPPGQAVATDLAAWVGIGDSPAEPLPEEIASPEIVIGGGQAAPGVPYEVVASHNVEPLDLREREETCGRIGFPTIENDLTLMCLDTEFANRLQADVIVPRAIVGPEELGANRLVVRGFALPNVQRVEVQFQQDGERRTVAADISALTARLAEDIGAPEPVSFLTAFLPVSLIGPLDALPQIVPPPGEQLSDETVRQALESMESHPALDALRAISVVAYDADGNELARSDLAQSPHAAATLNAGR